MLQDPCNDVVIDLVKQPFLDQTLQVGMTQDYSQSVSFSDFVEMGDIPLRCGNLDISFSIVLDAALYTNAKIIASEVSEDDPDLATFTFKRLTETSYAGRYQITFSVYLKDYPMTRVRSKETFEIVLENPCLLADEDNSGLKKP